MSFMKKPSQLHHVGVRGVCQTRVPHTHSIVCTCCRHQIVAEGEVTERDTNVTCAGIIKAIGDTNHTASCLNHLSDCSRAHGGEEERSLLEQLAGSTEHLEHLECSQ